MKPSRRVSFKHEKGSISTELAFGSKDPAGNASSLVVCRYRGLLGGTVRALWIGLLWAALAQPTLAGELLTYRTPDGNMGITDNPKLVPPGSQILRRDPETPQQGETSRDPVPPAAARRSLPTTRSGDADPDVAAAARWRQRLRQARQEEERAAHALEQAERDYRSCRHRENFGSSYQAHIPGETTCDEAPVVAAQHEYERAKAYAEDGIEDECRRAGCLPGWLR
jgi:hypothetical protein